MAEIPERVLDVGCGPYKATGAIGVDQFSVPGVDVVCDLNKPWPFSDRCFDRVLFSHSIIHLKDLLFVMKSAERVCKRGGAIKIISPHFSSDNVFTDPTINFFLGYRSMDFFCANTGSLYKYYSDSNLTLERRWIHLYKSRLTKPIEHIVNAVIYPIELLFNTFPRIYEHFLCFIVRANEVVFVLRVE